MSQTINLDRALELWKSDRIAEGELLLRGEVSTLEAKFSRLSLEYEVASGELATYLWVVGNEVAAIDIWHDICFAPMPIDSDAVRNRLTQIMNFGELLTTVGEFDRAETVLQQGLEGRLKYYGCEHPGYAFGLEPLAGVWLYQGKFESALQAIDLTIDIFAKDGHERIIGATVLKSEILKTGGVETYLFESLEEWELDSIGDFTSSLFLRVGNFTPPQIARLLLLDLVQLLIVKVGKDGEILLSTYAKLAEIERQLGEDGNAHIRQDSIGQIFESYQRQGNLEGSISALMALAYAQSDNNEIEPALKSYSRALALAEGGKNPELSVQVMRNYGIFLKDIGQKSAARDMLDRSITLAQQHNLIEATARCQIALGIFVQHEGEIESARQLLELGTAKLNSSDRDRVCGVNHLRAIERGIACCSDAMPDTILESCREFILSKISSEAVKDIEISDDDGLTVNLNFHDHIEEDEKESIVLQVNYAFREFQQNLARS
jgi:tetratricopeptide (TPR) repeat protein